MKIINKDNRGGKRSGAGRKRKVEETEMISLLAPYESLALQKLAEGIKAGEFGYVKLYFEYYFGRPSPASNELERLSEEDLDRIIEKLKQKTA